jgi:uncharacterized protein
MLRNTFCHLPRLGPRSEQKLWQQGITTWSDFLAEKRIHRIAPHRKPLFDQALKNAQKAVLLGDSAYFNILPSVEQWRLWEEFGDEAAFIDIETNYRHDITVLGIADSQGGVWQFVRHHNMDGRKVRELLSNFKLLVTFNGASFDLPIMRRYFQDVLPRVPHIDLRHAAARAGHSGGLKAIEKSLGIARLDAVKNVSGADALRLWTAYRQTGEKRFLELLLEYNAEDIVNLKPLAQAVYDQLQAQVLPQKAVISAKKLL